MLSRRQILQSLGASVAGALVPSRGWAAIGSPLNRAQIVDFDALLCGLLLENRALECHSKALSEGLQLLEMIRRHYSVWFGTVGMQYPNCPALDGDRGRNIAKAARDLDDLLERAFVERRRWHHAGAVNSRTLAAWPLAGPGSTRYAWLELRQQLHRSRLSTFDPHAAG